MRPFPRHRSGGFTLVELLLATALLSILLGLAYSGLRSSIRAADRGQVILEESNRLRMSHQFVHRQLNQMLPLGFAQSEADNSFTVFQGSRQFARYVSPMPGYLGFGGPQVQELALVPSETSDGKALVLNHALLQGFEETDLYQSEPILLIDGISDAEFLFQGVEDGELTGWIADWEEESTVPKAVSLSIEFEEGSYVIWPLLTAIVRIDNMAVRLSGAQKSAYSANMDRLLNSDKKN